MTLRLENVERVHLALLGAAGALAFVTQWISPWSLLLGGAVMGANFWLMRQLFRRLLTTNRAGRIGAVVGLAVAKFALFMGLLALLFWRVPLDALAFGVGATILLVACVAEALRHGTATS